MKGKIIKYIEDKGYGFILDENGLKRFFHISDTLSPLDIKLYQMVEFEPEENNKGLVSKKIQITHKNNDTKFITINNTNIKCNNIKQFGISSDKEILYKRNKSILALFAGNDEEVIVRYEDLPYETIMGPGTRELPTKDTRDYTKIERTYDYLYITTYQGDNHKLRGNIKELEEKMKYIKEALNS